MDDSDLWTVVCTPLRLCCQTFCRNYLAGMLSISIRYYQADPRVAVLVRVYTEHIKSTILDVFVADDSFVLQLLKTLELELVS